MPLEHILRAMQAQADSEIEATSRAAAEEAAQLIAEAEEQGRAIRARHRARVEPALLTGAAGLQNKAKLSALRATANAREQLLTEAFAQAENCLQEIRQSKAYAAIFQTLAEEVARELGNQLIVRVDPQDAELARGVFAKLGVQAEIQTQITPLGGLEATAQEGRVVAINTLAARLGRARSVLRGPVAKILTEEPKTDPEWKTSTATPMPA